MIRIMLPIVWFVYCKDFFNNFYCFRSHVIITIAAITVFLFMIFVVGLPIRYFSLFEVRPIGNNVWNLKYLRIL